MSRINVKHLLLGTIAAALVINACDWVINNYILSDTWRLVAQTHNVDQFQMNGNGATAIYVGVDCLIGFLLIWTYTAIRPRLGPGPSTALIASFVVTGTAILITATYGGWFIPWDLFIKSSALMFTSYTAGALAGAWVYREDEPEE